MSNGNGVSRGDRNRNARLSRLPVLVPVCNAIVGIDLADKKQMVVVTDHDSKILARRTFSLSGVGSWVGVGLGGPPSEQGRLRRGERGV
jgi:hypothetical protein